MSLNLDDVKTLLQMMQEHGVLELSFDGLAVRRTPYVEPEKPKLASHNPDFVRELEQMPSDTQDKLLMLRRTRGGV